MRGQLWAGRALSALAILFLTFDSAIKLLNLPVAVGPTVQLGYPASLVVTIGLIEATCLILYVVPRTAIFGAVLWTGYLGGAVASHLRHGDSVFGMVLFPIYVAVLLWGGLWLRDARVRALVAAPAAQ